MVGAANTGVVGEPCPASRSAPTTARGASGGKIWPGAGKETPLNGSGWGTANGKPVPIDPASSASKSTATVRRDSSGPCALPDDGSGLAGGSASAAVESKSLHRE